MVLLFDRGELRVQRLALLAAGAFRIHLRSVPLMGVTVTASNRRLPSERLVSIALPTVL